MSATIIYRIKRPDKTLPVYAPSHFMEVLETVFGTLPKTFGESDLERLRVIKVLNNDEGWEKLVELIEKHGDIELSVSY